MSEALAIIFSVLMVVWMIAWQFVLPMVGLFYIFGWLS